MERETTIQNKRGTVINYVPDYELTPAKENLTIIKLSPIIPFGSDNLFPQATALFARSSPVHRGVINSKGFYFVGGGITSEDQQLIDEFKSVNFQGESLNDIAGKFFQDRNTGGNAWIEIITDRNFSFIWFNHIDFTKARLAKNQKEVYLHPDWASYRGEEDPDLRKLPIYPNFEAQADESGIAVLRSIYQVKDYEPEFFYYGVPQWIAGKDSILIDLKTNKWNLARLKNAFSTSGFLIVPVKDAKEGDEVISYIEKNYTGEGNQAKLMVVTKSRATEGEKADTTQFIETRQNDEGSWQNLHAQSLTDALIAHGWFRSLTNIPDNTGFDTKRILNEYAVARSTIIPSEQKVFTDFVKRIYSDLQGKDIEISFINRAPLSDESWKFIWEIRRDRGDDYDENDPKQQIIVIPDGYRTMKTDGSTNFKE